MRQALINLRGIKTGILTEDEDGDRKSQFIAPNKRYTYLPQHMACYQ